MSSFLTLQKELNEAKQRKAVLMYVADYLEAQFMAAGTLPASNFILSDDKVQIPQEAFDSVVASILEEVADLDLIINKIQQSTLQPSKANSNKDIQ